MLINYKRNAWLIVILIVMLFIRITFELGIRVFEIDVTFTEYLDSILRFTVTFFSVVIFVHIVSKSEYSVSKLPWLLILVIEPLTGLVLFLTFGRNFRDSFRYRKHPKIHDGNYLIYEPRTDFNDARYLAIDSEITDIYKTAYNMTKHHAYLFDSKVIVINNGVDFYERLYQEIENAQKYIFMQFYIIRTDKTGKKILNLLREKAKQGIEVKILYDALGSVFLNKRFLHKLEEVGIIIEPIDPIYFAFFDTKMNFRNHRKNIIIDGKVAYTGGMNLADEYQNKHRRKRFPKFRDTQLEVRGKAVNSLLALFIRDWYYVTDDFIDDFTYYTADIVPSNDIVQIIPSGPDFKYPPIRNTYVKMINNAKESIKIMTPYLALDQELITSLIIASRGGVNVEIIVPGVPDKKSVYEVTKSFFSELLAEGIKIYTMTGMFTHAKVFIIDNHLASCGTYNLDNRSARINFELTVLLHGEAVKQLVDDFRLDRSNSKEILLHKWNKRSIIQRTFEGLVGLVSPLI
jgi:cardiolipin synthase